MRGAHRAPVMDVPVILQLKVPAVLRERGGASVSVPRQSAPTFSCASEAFTRSANCAKAGASTVQFLLFAVYGLGSRILLLGQGC